MLKFVKQQFFVVNKLFISMRNSSSVVSEKVADFGNAAATWWDPQGSMKHMHLIHPHQVSFVRRQLALKDGAKAETNLRHPLAGYKIADVGCGVGVNSESLAFLGAEVTGMDPAVNTIEVAKAHAASNPKLERQLKYLVSTAEDHVLTHSGRYDAAMVFFVLEHIRNRQEFIDNCLALLKPNGSLFVGNPSRSLVSNCYIWWHKHVSGLLRKSQLLDTRRFLTDDQVIAMVNKGHPCQLKGQLNLYWPLDGRSCRETESKRSVVFSHFLKATESI